MSQNVRETNMPGSSRRINILVVEDDPQVVEALESLFDLYEWEVTAAGTGEQALRYMGRARELDVILLDVGLPDISGFEVLERSQEMGVVAPVIIISTNSSDESKLRAFDLRAEDYLTKPLDPDVLKARIEEVVGIRPSGAALAEERLSIGSVEVDLKQGQVYREGKTWPLPEVERNLLRVLSQCHGCVVSRKRLLEEGMDIAPDALMASFTLRVLYEMLDIHVEALRKMIESDPEHPKYLERVYGQGYRLRT